MNHRNQGLGSLFALVCVVIWGTSFIVSKNLLGLFTPIQLMVLRFAIAYLALWVLHPKWYFNWRDEAFFLLVALFANTLYFWAENLALSHTLASNVSILVSTSPLLTAMLLKVLAPQEPRPKNSFLGSFLAFIGVCLIVLNGRLVLKISPFGDFLALAAAYAWAIYGFLIRHRGGQFNGFLLTRKIMFYGLVTSLPLLLFQSSPWSKEAFQSPGTWLSLAYLAIIASALCYILWNSAVQSLGAFSSNFFMYLIPLVTLITGAIFLNEPITLMSIAGMILVILGMILTTSKKPRVSKEDFS